MIIIDTHAHGKLVQTLEAIENLEGKYCIQFRAYAESERLRQQIIISTHHRAPDSQVYFCEDGEVFLIAHKTSLRDCKKIMLEIANALKVEPADNIGQLYDLEVQIGTLLTLLDEKNKTRRKQSETDEKQRTQEMAARKRQEILNEAVTATATDVSAKRKARKTPELMIIEDDIFSRRLVEKVLQKQYRLTGLADAEGALATYAQLAPDVLFLDINLPDVTGHELLEKIIALDPEAYIVMLSGNADRENIMQALNQGAKGFVAKPFSRDKLFQYIERCPTIGA